MNLERLDHVAIEVSDLDYYVEQLVRTGGMKLLRRATAKRSGTRMAMVGDPTGMKLELIENRGAARGAPGAAFSACRLPQQRCRRSGKIAGRQGVEMGARAD